MARRRFFAAYDDEVHPEQRSFWQSLPKQHPFAQNPLMALQGDELQRASRDWTQARMQQAQSSPTRAMQAFGNLVRLESQHKEELQEAAKRIVNQIWGFPVDRMVAVLTQQVDHNQTRQTFRNQASRPVTPEARQDINKRITTRTLAQGASVHGMMTAHHLEAETLAKIDPRLAQLYNQFSSGAHGMYWDIPKMSGGDLASNAIGSSRIDYDSRPPKVIAKAHLFPVLVQELVKGVVQLISDWQLEGKDKNQVANILYHAEDVESEPHEIQVGPELWRRVLKVIPRGVPLPRVMMLLSRTPAQELDRVIRAVTDDPEMAQEWFREHLEV